MADEDPRDGRHDEDEAWQEIVANYGEAPSADELDVPAPPPEPPARPDIDRTSLPGQRIPGSLADPDSGHRVAWEEGWTPPDPGPQGWPSPKRLAAWAGVLGAPAILLICLVAAVDLPTWFTTALVAWFVGGFAYLVATMKPGRDDPWDDGARV